jgi:hypothetical protein
VITAVALVAAGVVALATSATLHLDPPPAALA